MQRAHEAPPQAIDLFKRTGKVQVKADSGAAAENLEHVAQFLFHFRRLGHGVAHFVPNQLMATTGLASEFNRVHPFCSLSLSRDSLIRGWPVRDVEAMLGCQSGHRLRVN